MAVLSIRGLSKSYGDFIALKDLDLTLEKGKCLGLLGSNGAGKSTTIRIVTGQLRPSKGQVEVFGIDPSVHPKKIHPKIGYIPDTQTLYDDLTVRENISVFASLFDRDASAVERILSDVGLIEKAKEKVKKLSKGLRQRVLIARALVHEPQFIILDEPTTGLDPSSAESIYSILEDLKSKGATILLTTHLMNDVDRLCDQIVFINRGEKVEEGSPAELKSRHSDSVIEVDVKTGGVLKKHRFHRDQDWIGELTRLQAVGEIQGIKTHEPKLEEIFIKLVGQSS